MMPSHRRMLPPGSRGRAMCSSGITTVGPDTTRIAPINAAPTFEMSKRSHAVVPPITQVMNAPTVTNRRTADRPAVNRSILSPRPPS